MELIPAIIAKNIKELKQKIKIIEPYFSIAQLDVMDGRFVDNKTLDDIREIKEIKTSLKWEIHLMAQKPEEQIYTWSVIKPQRFIFHFEAESRLKTEDLIQKIKNYGMEAGIALNPETPVSAIEEFLSDLDLALLMSVHPGFGGQEFLEPTIEKIEELRQMWPTGNIEIDGGINLETGRRCVTAGANILVAGSAIFEAKDIKKVIEEFERVG